MAGCPQGRPAENFGLWADFSFLTLASVAPCAQMHSSAPFGHCQKHYAWPAQQDRKPRLRPWATMLGACAMTTKFLDNIIFKFKILLSWRFPRKKKKKNSVSDDFPLCPDLPFLALLENGKENLQKSKDFLSLANPQNLW